MAHRRPTPQEPPLGGVHDEKELASLAAALSRRVSYAKAVLLVGEALGLTARDLLSYTQKDFRAALREISVKKYGEVARAIAASEAASMHAGRSKLPALGAIASLVLELREAGSKLDLVERAVIACAMSACGGNQSAAARMLGVERKALARRLAKRRVDADR